MRVVYRRVLPSARSENEYPLLWNCMFVSDRDDMELRGEFRYESARKEQAFVANRFTHTVEGFTAGFNPYTVNVEGKIGKATRPGLPPPRTPPVS